MGRKWYRNCLWMRRISFDPVEFYFLLQVVCPPSTSDLWEWFWWMCIRKGFQFVCPYMLVTVEVWSGARQKEGCHASVYSLAGDPTMLLMNLCGKQDAWITSADLILDMLSCWHQPQLQVHSWPRFKILVLITKSSVFPHCCHLECFPITFFLTRDLNCFLSEQEKNRRLCFAVNSRFPCFHLAAGIQTAFAIGTVRMWCAKNS